MQQMVKSFLLISTLFITLFLGAQTASESVNAQSNEQFKVIPKEKVYVHYNASLLFSGEKLQYKLYFIDLSTKKLSAISKIGYITLVDKNGVKVFSHKIILKNGAGHGDFFVSSSIPTGSYKLLAYSQWMRNQGIDSFFQSNIQIINPYKPIPLENRAISKDSLLGVNKKLSSISVKNIEKGTANNFIDLSLTNENVGKRQKLSLKLTPSSTNVEKGTYSISIRKLDKIRVLNDISLNEFGKQVIKTPFLHTKNAKVEWIPELRGELISGKILYKESKKPVHGEKVALSLPGTNYLFHVATTNKKGNFYFNVDKRYDNSYGTLQIKSPTSQDLDIILDEHSLDVSGLEFLDFYVSDQLENFIKERSLHNQIENAYVEEKSDSIVPSPSEFSFYRDMEITYQLDDYNRFNSISETIIEIIDRVSLGTLKNGKRVFRVRPPEGYTPDMGFPLVFIDGLYIQNHEDILGYSAKNLKSISFSTNRYLIGTEIFQGILHFETIAQNYSESYYNPKVKNHTLFRPQPEKINYYQSYEASREVSNRIPDFRHQLLWTPRLNLANNKEVHFYSSDVSGDYEIVFEGFTQDGQAVSIKKFFTIN